jgi:hypothetical protein
VGARAAGHQDVVTRVGVAVGPALERPGAGVGERVVGGGHVVVGVVEVHGLAGIAQQAAGLPQQWSVDVGPVAVVGRLVVGVGARGLPEAPVQSGAVGHDLRSVGAELRRCRDRVAAVRGRCRERGVRHARGDPQQGNNDESRSQAPHHGPAVPTS